MAELLDAIMNLADYAFQQGRAYERGDMPAAAASQRAGLAAVADILRAAELVPARTVPPTRAGTPN